MVLVADHLIHAAPDVLRRVVRRPLRVIPAVAPGKLIQTRHRHLHHVAHRADHVHRHARHAAQRRRHGVLLCPFAQCLLALLVLRAFLITLVIPHHLVGIIALRRQLAHIRRTRRLRVRDVLKLPLVPCRCAGIVRQRGQLLIDRGNILHDLCHTRILFGDVQIIPLLALVLDRLIQLVPQTVKILRLRQRLFQLLQLLHAAGLDDPPRHIRLVLVAQRRALIVFVALVLLKGLINALYLVLRESILLRAAPEHRVPVKFLCVPQPVAVVAAYLVIDPLSHAVGGTQHAHQVIKTKTSVLVLAQSLLLIGADVLIVLFQLVLVQPVLLRRLRRVRAALHQLVQRVAGFLSLVVVVSLFFVAVFRKPAFALVQRGAHALDALVQLAVARRVGPFQAVRVGLHITQLSAQRIKLLPLFAELVRRPLSAAHLPLSVHAVDKALDVFAGAFQRLGVPADLVVCLKLSVSLQAQRHVFSPYTPKY